ncbi:MAG: hypothetical protein JWP74_3665 [Marmoricola sp.]|nr:hypothetical protein [Marmoricola sp.]
MITSIIISIGLTVVGGLLGLFPAYTLPSSMTSLGSDVGSAVGAANGIFPIVTLGVCLVAVAGVWLFMAAFDLAVWVYELIPMKAT